MIRLLGSTCLVFGLALLPAGAQQRPIDYSANGINLTKGRSWIKTIFGQGPIPVSLVHTNNSPLVYTFIKNGQLQLTLDDAVALALENNLDIAIQRLNLPIADTDIMRARGGTAPRGVSTGIVSGTPGGGGPTTGGAGATGAAPGGTTTAVGGAGAGAAGIVSSTLGGGPPVPSFDPSFLSTYEISDATTPESITFITGTTQLITHTGTANFSYNQGFLPGTELSIGFQNSRTTSNNQRTLFNPTLNSGLQISITQPFLQGFGASVNGRNLVIAKNNREISDIAFRQQVEATVAQVEDIYWNAVSARDAVTVAQGALALAEKILADNQRQVQIGTMAPLSVTQEQAVVATDRQNLITAQTNYEYNQLLLKNAVTKDMSDPRLADIPAVPTDTITVSPNEPVQPVQDLIKQALQYRPELAISRINLVNQNISLRAVKQELLPTLDLIGTYGATGLAGQVVPGAGSSPFGGGATDLGPFIGGYGRALTNVFQGNYPTYTVGLQLNIPITNHSGQADVVRAQLELQQTQLQQQQQTNQIILEVRNAQFTVQQDRAAVAAAQEAVRLQQETLDAAQKKFNLGATTITEVITDQNALTQAQSNLVAALTNYEEAKVNLERLTGTTLTANRISVQDAENGKISQMPHVRE
ncbi:MAG TPA: TolC family protein [Terriglobales bacterium]|nr:TolC family protein [Terriglobales bacterium]